MKGKADSYSCKQRLPHVRRPLSFFGPLVYSQIEAQSRALSSPRRSRSIQRDGGSHSRFPSLAASTPGSEVDLHGGISKARQSSDSGGSGHAIAAAQSTSSRSSTEKSRAKKLFGRTSADKEGSQTGGDTGHKRNESFISSGRRSVTPFDDGPGSSPSATEVCPFVTECCWTMLTSVFQLEFDELMRSGTTMKVSLTPDRLRTFEASVFFSPSTRLSSNPHPAQQTHKGQQRRQGLSTATNLPLNGKAELGIEEVTVMDGNDISSLKNGISVLPSRPAVPRSVDSILEDDENGGISGVGGDKVSVRLRKESKGAPPAPVVTASARSRSKSASATPSTLGANSGLMRKSSLNALGHNLPTLPPMPKMFSDSDGMPIRKRPKASRKDSIDEILGSSDDDDELMKSSFRPKAAQSNGVSSRDLISFLNDGPPDFGPTPSIASTQSQANEGRAKQGRFRSMVSKLTRGGSTEKLVSNHGVGSDALNPPKKSTSSNHPPPSFIPPPLSAKKSLHSISSFPLSADKPFSSAPTTLTLPPPSPGKSFSESISMSPSRTRISPVTTRKAVPVFDLGSQRPSSSAPPPTPLQKETTPISPAKEEPSIRVSPVKSQSNVSIKQQDTVPQAKSNADTKAMFTTATTTTVKERRSSVQSRPADIIISKAREEEKSDVPPAIRPKRTSSIDGGLPSPTWQKLSPMSKSTQRHALTPPATPSSSVFAAHAKDMRRLMASASNADECRLLVDMFLAQAGFPVRPTDFHSDPQKEPSDHQQASVVAALLGHDDIPSEQIPTREAINTSHSASESSLPTPRSPVHSPAPSLSRKALPGEVHNLVSPVVVLAEA